MLDAGSWMLDVGDCHCEGRARSRRLGVITGNMKKEQKNY